MTTQVIFACQKCSAAFVANQIRSERPTLRQIFRCTHCRTQVHSWEGDFDFLNWRPVSQIDS